MGWRWGLRLGAGLCPWYLGARAGLHLLQLALDLRPLRLLLDKVLRLLRGGGVRGGGGGGVRWRWWGSGVEVGWGLG